MSYLIRKILFIAIALLGISFVITIHELGHFSFAKLFNIPVKVFSIGFGPVLYKRYINKTRFQVAALPLGGYVKIAGFDSTHPESKSFNEVNLLTNKPYYQKLLVMIGGILFNFIFSILALIFILLFGKQYYITDATKEHTEKALSPLQNSYYILMDMFVRLKRVLARSGKSKQNIQGPVGIIAMMTESVGQGFVFFLFFLGILSLNLALINLLPIPLLDGGQIMFMTIEALLGRQINPKLENNINMLFFILLMLFFLYITAKDIKNLTK